MSQPPSPVDQITAQNSHVWVQYVPDGAVSVAVEDSILVLKASAALQERVETFDRRGRSRSSDQTEKLRSRLRSALTVGVLTHRPLS
jgi:hypothetical protein